MIYICTNCSNYTYDEAKWDKTEWISAWTMFDDIDNEFCCPSCYASKDYFLTIKEEILEPEDKNNLSYLEKVHVPKVEIIWEKCNIVVWFEEHPMIEEHYIYSIWIYDEYGDLIEEKLLTSEDLPEASFDISDFDEFSIQARCNQHGIWTTWIIKK